MSTSQDLAAAAISQARRNEAKSAAAFDYSIATNGIGAALTSPLGNAVYILANEHLPEITPGTGEAELTRREQNGLRLWEQLQPELRAYEKRCKERKYTGWSNYSAGPIRYAK